MDIREAQIKLQQFVLPYIQRDYRDLFTQVQKDCKQTTKLLLQLYRDVENIESLYGYRTFGSIDGVKRINDKMYFFIEYLNEAGRVLMQPTYNASRRTFQEYLGDYISRNKGTTTYNEIIENAYLTLKLVYMSLPFEIISRHIDSINSSFILYVVKGSKTLYTPYSKGIDSGRPLYNYYIDNDFSVPELGNNAFESMANIIEQIVGKGYKTFNKKVKLLGLNADQLIDDENCRLELMFVLLACRILSVGNVGLLNRIDRVSYDKLDTIMNIVIADEPEVAYSKIKEIIIKRY